ncbi:MAG: hypothetical protein ACKOB4_18110 [Acidobacteriota bacterium]
MTRRGKGSRLPLISDGPAATPFSLDTSLRDDRPMIFPLDDPTVGSSSQ